MTEFVALTACSRGIRGTAMVIQTLGRDTVHVNKDEVVDLLRSRGEHDKAASLECALPRQVDTEADAGVLHQFDVSISEITQPASDGADDRAHR